MGNHRSGGILLHPTSLPGPYGIGDLGPEAHALVDWLADAGCDLWQVLPLGPTGYGNSPYQCHSAFAGNINLISPEQLVAKGYLASEDLTSADLHPAAAPASRRVDFARVIPWKRKLLDRVYWHFQHPGSAGSRHRLDDFVEQNRWWLQDYALFMALKESHDEAAWMHWPPEHRTRNSTKVSRFDPDLQEAVRRVCLAQMLFFEQWTDLRERAHRRGVRIIGDIPIFAAEDSADVWARTDLFCLDHLGRPTAVSGVPPDYFAPTGQLWGNPLYDWAAHKSSGYEWWRQRLRAVLGMVDIVRFDHFRGLAAYWAVTGGSPTAESGRWMPGPGYDFLDAILVDGTSGRNDRDTRIIAEDLGVLTPDVSELLGAYDMPGMRVLQFGLAGHTDDYLPEHYIKNCAAYTGTHDNDTARGWFMSSSEADRAAALKRMATTESRLVMDMIRAIWDSKAMWAIAPVQDLLDLGTDARMNFPGKLEGNWEWRMAPGQLTPELAANLRALNQQCHRGVLDDRFPGSAS